jgi:hypothetical protein
LPSFHCRAAGCLWSGQAILQDNGKIRQMACRNVQRIQVDGSARRYVLLQLITDRDRAGSPSVDAGSASRRCRMTVDFPAPSAASGTKLPSCPASSMTG